MTRKKKRKRTTFSDVNILSDDARAIHEAIGASARKLAKIKCLAGVPVKGTIGKSRLD
jgi:hypothetical protein|tara:strand:- start:277 stop:450 length:174 start_codon:yes stop_codon:yes gene_type:complete